jgi:glycosyltransferase involved in cell wall biosynthesis
MRDLMYKGLHGDNKNMRPLTILHTEAATGWGGQQMRVLHEVSGLIGRGHQVMLACQPGSEIAGRAPEWGVPVFITRIGGAFDIPGICRLAALIRRYRPDIVNTHSSRDSWTGLTAAKLLRGPVTVRTRHMLVPIKPTLDNRLLYGKLNDAIVTTGDAVKRQVIACLEVSPDSVVSIPTGIDLDRFNPAEADGTRFRDDIGVPAGAPLVGAVGLMLRAKGHTYLVDAAALIVRERPDVRFVLVGGVPAGSRMLEHLTEQVASLGLKDRFVFAGYRSDIPDVMAGLDVLALPSLSEGVPQVVGQAMAMKKPVVATDVGGVSEQVIDGRTGFLVQKADPEQMARAVLKVLGDAAGAREMGENGRRLVEEKFSLDAMLDATEALYYKLCADRQPLLSRM